MTQKLKRFRNKPREETATKGNIQQRGYNRGNSRPHNNIRDNSLTKTTT
jgi:hypothetical protein